MKRFLKSLAGIFIYAISINNLVSINIGVRSQDLFIQTLEKVLNITRYSLVYFLFELFFFVLLIIFFKQLKVTKHELLASIISISFLSFIIDRTSGLIFFNSNYLSFIIVMLSLNFGLYLITQGNLIITPLDKFLVHISIKYQTSYGKLRLALDTSLIVLVEVMTLVVYGKNSITIPLIACTLLSGPIIHIYESLFSVHTSKSNKLGRKQ